MPRSSSRSSPPREPPVGEELGRTPLPSCRSRGTARPARRPSRSIRPLGCRVCPRANHVRRRAPSGGSSETTVSVAESAGSPKRSSLVAKTGLRVSSATPGRPRPTGRLALSGCAKRAVPLLVTGTPDPCRDQAVGGFAVDEEGVPDRPAREADNLIERNRQGVLDRGRLVRRGSGSAEELQRSVRRLECGEHAVVLHSDLADLGVRLDPDGRAKSPVRWCSSMSGGSSVSSVRSTVLGDVEAGGSPAGSIRNGNRRSISGRTT